MPRPRWIASLFVVPFLLAVGCSDDDDSSGSGGDSAAETTAASEAGSTEDPCALLSTDQVAELLQQDVEEGELEEITDENASGAGCTWETVEESQSDSVDGPITLRLLVAELTPELEANLEEALEDPNNQPLPDVGDGGVQVCALTDDFGCSRLDDAAAAVGDVYVETNLSNFGYPDDFSEEDAAAIPLSALELAVETL